MGKIESVSSWARAHKRIVGFLAFGGVGPIILWAVRYFNEARDLSEAAGWVFTHLAPYWVYVLPLIWIGMSTGTAFFLAEKDNAFNLGRCEGERQIANQLNSHIKEIHAINEAGFKKIRAFNDAAIANYFATFMAISLDEANRRVNASMSAFHSTLKGAILPDGTVGQLGCALPAHQNEVVEAIVPIAMAYNIDLSNLTEVSPTEAAKRDLGALRDELRAPCRELQVALVVNDRARSVLAECDRRIAQDRQTFRDMLVEEKIVTLGLIR